MEIDSGKQPGKTSTFKDGFLRRYKLWLVLGVVISGVIGPVIIHLMRLMNQMAVTQLTLAGDTASAAYQSAVITGTMLDHIWMQLFLLGFSFIKIGIGGALYVAIKKLRSSRVTALRAAGVTGPIPKEPVYMRIAPWILMAGSEVQIVNFFGPTLWWSTNAANWLSLQFAGLTNTPAYLSATILERSLGTVAVTGEFAGATLALAGVALLAATLIAYLKAEGQTLPQVFSALKTKVTQPLNGTGINATLHDFAPKKLLAFTYALIAIGLSGIVVLLPATVSATVQKTTLELTGAAGTPAFINALFASETLNAFIFPWVFIGVGGTMVATALWLFHGLRYFEKKGVLGSLAFTNGNGLFKASRVTKIAAAVAATGFAILLVDFVLGLMRVQFVSAMLTEVISGRAGQPAFMQSMMMQMLLNLLTQMLNLTGGMAFANIGIGLAAAVLISYLRHAEKYLPQGLTGKQVNGDSKTRSLSLAKWKPFVLTAIGSAFIIFGTIPGVPMIAGLMQQMFALQAQGLTATPEFGQVTLMLQLLMIMGPTLVMTGIFFVLTATLRYAHNFAKVLETRHNIIVQALQEQVVQRT